MRDGDDGSGEAPAAQRPGQAADQAMERYADGEDAAFAELYALLAPALRRFGLRQQLGAAAADDLAQQTLLQLHLNRAGFVRGAAVLPWAYAIARNLVRDAGRHRHREDLLEQEAAGGMLAPAAAAAPDEALEHRRREEQLRRDLALLPANLREAFLLVKVEGLPIRDAAEVLGISGANVKVRAHRALEALRRAGRALDLP